MNTAFIVCGGPASGKSTYAARLAAEKGAALVDIDETTERLVRLSLTLSGHDPDDRDSLYFKEHYREPVYQAMFDVARMNLPHLDVVIAGPFTREIEDPSWKKRLERSLSSRVEVHYLRADAEVRRKRLIARGNPRDAGKLADWESFIKYYGEEEPPAFDHVLIDTTNEKSATA